MKTRTCIHKSLIAAALGALSLAWSAHGATIGELGILQGSANGGINPATGNPWQTGDQYRLAFISSGTRNATSPDIADYDVFVQAAADAVGWSGATWRCAGQSHNDPSAQTNTGTGGGGGVAIFLVDGTTKIADNYTDLWNGSIDNNWDLTEIGTTYAGSVASGSSRKFGDPGQSKIEHGRQPESGGAWWQVFNGNQSSQWHFYALSDPLTVVSGGPDTDPPVLVSKDPVDNSTGFPINVPLVATFDETITASSGNITINNLSGPDTIISISDTNQVSVSGKVLTISPATLLLPSTAYAVRIDNGAILDFFGNAFPGISDDTTWNFTTGGDSLLIALDELTDHIDGTSTLTLPEIAAHKATLDTEKGRLDESTTAISKAFNLVSTYDSVEGPLFVSGSTVLDFNRNNTNPGDNRRATDDNIHWVVLGVMQYIFDEIYNTAALADPAKRALIDGYLFGSSADFPGSVAPPPSPGTHTATINASFPETFGRDTQHWTWPARKPTGTYLAPGSIVTVTVPPALVNQGIQVQVGAHSWDHEAKNRPPVKRLSRATLLYDVDATSIDIASPYGGGIYFEIPKGLVLGVASVDITGAVRSPYFSLNSVSGHVTNDAEWISTERNHPAPWADFQTEKFMMQVPTSWVDAVNDPTARMAKWDAAMDAINDLMGFPRIRGKETMYIQTDVIFRSSVHAPGYPATNVNYNPKGNYNGDVNNYFVQGPRYGASTEFHEQGHAYFFPKFGGETEANVNLPYVPVLNTAFGVGLDESFRSSTGFPGANTDPLDKTAVLWMTSFNFAPREQPMANWEKAYQPQGHARWVDIARLFGWDGMGAYWKSFMEDDANSISYGTSTDDLLLRLCRNVNEDIRPLFHFWGIHPQNPSTLAAAVSAEGLAPSPEIYNLLQHYRTLVPADNAAYQVFCLDWYNGVPGIGGFGVEREHTRQWDMTSYWQSNGWAYSGTDPGEADGEIYLEASAARIETVVDDLIDLYFPGGPPVSDYDTWAAQYPGHDLSDPDADITGNGWSNNEARIFGLDPTDGSSANPFTVPLDAATGTFSYTRRDNALTGLTYSVWTSTDCQSWTEDTGAIQVDGTPDANGVEIIAVTLSPALLNGARLFVKVVATD